ncbi:MAG: VacJ family lipoprotein [Caulobacteraceae bacterium]|nr:VacJ family lipoprotein [Caulobacteraceae bacterium]
MRPARLYLIAIVYLAIGVSAAQAAAPGRVPEDPYERTNRAFFAFQLKLNRWVVGPLLVVYRALTPGPIGKALHNLMLNVSEPVIIANDILQGRPKQVAHDTARLATNTTIGIGGLLDVASRTGLPYQNNDFGITLGRWGAKPGPYLFIPMVGPSTVRDLIGAAADVALSPLTFLSYPQKAEVTAGVTVVSGLDTFNQSESQLATLTGEAADPYATLRSVYLQNRAAQVSGEESPALPPLEDEPSVPETAAPSPAPAEAQPPPQIAPPPAGAVGPQSDAAFDPNAPVVTGRDWRYDALARRSAPSA